VERANNVSGQDAKAAKQHQAVSGYWQTQATLTGWCRNRSYLDSAAAHGITAPRRHHRRPREHATAAAPRRRDRSLKPQLAQAPELTPRSGVDPHANDRRGDGPSDGPECFDVPDRCPN
jgi:hypothetical protein